MYYLQYSPTVLTIGNDEMPIPKQPEDTLFKFASPMDLLILDDATMARCLRALNFEPEDALPANVRDIIFELTEQAELPVSSSTPPQAAEPPGQAPEASQPAQGGVYDIDSTDAVVRISTNQEPLPGSKRFTAADATDLDGMGSDLMLRCFFALGQKLNVLPPMASDVLFDLLGKSTLPASMSVQDWPLPKEKRPRKDKKSDKDLPSPQEASTSAPAEGDAPPMTQQETDMDKQEKALAAKQKAAEAKAKQKERNEAAKLKAKEAAAKQKEKLAADKAKAKEKAAADKAKAKEAAAKEKAKAAKDKPAGAVRTTGEPTMKMRLIALCQRDGGATMAQMLALTGWKACRGTLGQTADKLGLTLTKHTDPEGKKATRWEVSKPKG